METNKTSKDNSILKNAASGMGMGILMGSVSSFVTTRAFAKDEEVEQVEENMVQEEQPAWSDGNVAVATGVTDEMSFSQAFSAARAEVGTAGSFEWRGNVYSTFTAEEWNSMSAEERAEYNSHFNWSRVNSSESQTAESQTDGEESQINNEEESQTDKKEYQVVEEEAQIDEGEAQIDEGEIQVVEEQNSNDVVILGVIHDDETGANYGGAIIGGDNVVLLDIDGKDDQFDLMGIDANNDGKITEEEVVSIADEGIRVSDFESISDVYANSGEDYIADNQDNL